MLDFYSVHVVSFPGLFPGFALDARVAHRHNWNDESAPLINILVMVSVREQ